MPKTASASVLPVMCAMPQSSRVMLTLRACCAQRAASADGVAWNAKTVEAAASPIAASTSFLREWWFFMSYLPSILAHGAKGGMATTVCAFRCGCGVAACVKIPRSLSKTALAKQERHSLTVMVQKGLSKLSEIETRRWQIPRLDWSPNTPARRILDTYIGGKMNHRRFFSVVGLAALFSLTWAQAQVTPHLA